MPTLDGKSQKFELFEDLFQTSVKIHNQLTEEDKIYYFHSLMRGAALQTFKNIASPNRENLGEILTVFRRKYVKPQSMATPQLKQRNDKDSQTTSLKETSLQNPEPLRNSSEKMKLVANKYCASITARTLKTKPKEQLTASQLKCNGDDNFCLLTKQLHRCLGNACER